MDRGRIIRTAIFVGSLAVVTLALESLVRLKDLDLKMLAPLLYRVEGDFFYEEGIDIFRTSDDPHRVYETVPNTEVTCCAPSTRLNYPYMDGRDRNTIRINNLGFRDSRDRARSKPPGVFRMVVLGGSNVFGPSVSDEETYPAVLERRLNRLRPGRFEVWNGGINAYVLSQKVAYARRIITETEVDLLLISHENVGRRAFFYRETDVIPLLRRNRELLAENVPWWGPQGLSGQIHSKWASRSALYRFAAISLGRIKLDGAHSPDFERSAWFFADVVSQRMFREFALDRDRPPIVLLDRSGGWEVGNILDVFYISILEDLSERAVRAKEYLDPHPPAYVYEFYVERMLPKLLALGVLPVGNKQTANRSTR